MKPRLQTHRFALVRFSCWGSLSSASRGIHTELLLENTVATYGSRRGESPLTVCLLLPSSAPPSRISLDDELLYRRDSGESAAASGSCTVVHGAEI